MADFDSLYERITGNPHLALAAFHRGSHGCKFGFLGRGSVGHDLIAEFIEASHSELRRALEGEAFPVGEP